MLAEYRELLGQVAVQTGDVPKARPIVDLPVVPALKRMRAAAGDFDIEPVGTRDQGVAHRDQLGHQ